MYQNRSKKYLKSRSDQMNGFDYLKTTTPSKNNHTQILDQDNEHLYPINYNNTNLSHSPYGNFKSAIYFTEE